MDRSRLPPLARLVYSDWEDPPEELEFEERFIDILLECGELVGELSEGARGAERDPAMTKPEFWAKALRLFVRLPAVINVVLNWKICVEHGLPLHPTLYFEVKDEELFRYRYPAQLRRLTDSGLVDSIQAARSAMRLEAEAPARIRKLRFSVSDEVLDFVFTSVRDRYTWRASEPEKVAALAGILEREMKPQLIVGAAHGALLSGLVLAEMLEADLYFIRFSRFKRMDEEPIISASDEKRLAPYANSRVLLFDEDVARGTTLSSFVGRLRPLFADSRSASVIRHGLAEFRPDFVGCEWND